MSLNSKESIVITVWQAQPLYEQLEELLRRRPDGEMFILINENEQVNPRTDLLLNTAVSPCRIDDIFYHLPYASVTLPFAEAEDLFYLNYLLDEMLYSLRYYGLTVTDKAGEAAALGEIHTITQPQPKQMILHAEERNLIITDPAVMDMLRTCPAFIRGENKYYFSHHYTYYPQSKRLNVYWSSFGKHREAVQRYLDELASKKTEA